MRLMNGALWHWMLLSSSCYTFWFTPLIEEEHLIIFISHNTDRQIMKINFNITHKFFFTINLIKNSIKIPLQIFGNVLIQKRNHL